MTESSSRGCSEASCSSCWSPAWRSSPCAPGSVGDDSAADAGYLGYFPLVYVGLAMLVRARARELNWRLWLDGLIAALGAAFIFDSGYAVSASCGAPRVPEKAADQSAALQLADVRMYAQKESRRAADDVLAVPDAIASPADDDPLPRRDSVSRR